MRATETTRGFQIVMHTQYVAECPESLPRETRLVQCSSAIGDGSEPGSSYLWIGKEHHLDRNQVACLVSHLQQWLDTGKLFNT